MNIGILTQPLGHNYGGILQNWALQKVLERLGYNPYTIVYYGQSLKQQIMCDIIDILKFVVKYMIFHPTRRINSVPWDRKNPFEYLNKFLKTNTRRTKVIQPLSWRGLRIYKLRVIIVGSDQVWRPIYNKDRLEFMFGKLYGENCPIPMLSYAASFGVDYWEFSQEQTDMAKEQIKRFKFISVREESAIHLCKKYLNANVMQILDPTLLLSPSDYMRLLHLNSKDQKSLAKIGIYLLDVTETKRNIVNYVCEILGMEPMYFGIQDSRTNKYCKIEEWIDAFNSSDFIITDSFHGTVFSINFNKPFITIENNKRGNARLTSILSFFNLSDRLINNDDLKKIGDSIHSQINWANVNNILEMHRAKSLLWLSNAVNQSITSH